MQVILLERIGRLGQMGDVVTVKDGFARNFLLPQGKALRATEANRKRFEPERTNSKRATWSSNPKRRPCRPSSTARASPSSGRPGNRPALRLGFDRRHCGGDDRRRVSHRTQAGVARPADQVARPAWRSASRSTPKSSPMSSSTSPARPTRRRGKPAARTLRAPRPRQRKTPRPRGSPPKLCSRRAPQPILPVKAKRKRQRRRRSRYLLRSSPKERQSGRLFSDGRVHKISGVSSFLGPELEGFGARYR